MKLIQNIGDDRVIDLVRTHLKPGFDFDCMTPDFSLFAYSALREQFRHTRKARILMPSGADKLCLNGHAADRAARNQLKSRWLANECARWLTETVTTRHAPYPIPQSSLIVRNEEGTPVQAMSGSFSFSSSGLGLTPGNAMSLIQASEIPEEAALIANWFRQQWDALPEQPAPRENLLHALAEIGSYQDPGALYALILRHLFHETDEILDEERVLETATGFRNTKVWNKLYRFQRDAVIGAIDKLNRFGGCIIADSVGLGKTFEALAVIKYHELRNDRVLVLAPKRLRDNWSLYRANDKRNGLAADRFNYDLLNHTDLSRDRGTSGDIDLAQVNWGNYDLLVIDESHNFRNKSTHKDRESRYDRLMNRIIREGVKTRVLMLSATPVNNRLADLRNQIAFVTEGVDTALSEHGIASVDTTTRNAQTMFNRWLKLPDEEKSTGRLVEMLGFDYFTLLDHLTIARSRKHIERYYGTEETGRFPDRLPPRNIYADVDTTGAFRAIKEINREIRRLHLASYAPLRYVLPHKLAAYEKKYDTSVRGGGGTFRQLDREESLIHLMRVNALKRMESSVTSFRLTVERQLRDVDTILSRLDAKVEAVEEPDINEIDLEDPVFESLLAGKKTKVLLSDVDVVRWKQDLTEDRERLVKLLNDAEHVAPARDDKLVKLRAMIEEKARNPINPGNRKIIVFTAFADTAEYLYAQLANWALSSMGLHTGLITGSASIRSTLPGIPRKMGPILSAFAPRAKERPAEFASEGEIDLLIATDCISEGQNLQDCDWLVNYDIHWNPVRIIQRFGRIDRIGSPNTAIQLVNFWPNMELDEYIKLEERVSGRMRLLDISATGEENLIDQQSGDPMNDLEYRRRQLLQLQETVIDMEDLSSGVSITDLTLTDFRIDLAQYRKIHPSLLEALPMGVHGVATSRDTRTPPGVIFCLRAEVPLSKSARAEYPLAPHYLVHVGENGAVLLNHLQTKQTLDLIRRLAQEEPGLDQTACARLDRITRSGEEMSSIRKLLSAAITSVAGKQEERAAASLFSPGGTHARKGEFAGEDDFEVLAFLVVLPGEGA